MSASAVHSTGSPAALAAARRVTGDGARSGEGVSVRESGRDLVAEALAELRNVE